MSRPARLLTSPTTSARAVSLRSRVSGCRSRFPHPSSRAGATSGRRAASIGATAFSLLVGGVLMVDVPDGLELERAVLNVEMLGEAFSQRIEHLSAAAGGERFLADDDVN